jgi:hypothetical protein
MGADPQKPEAAALRGIEPGLSEKARSLFGQPFSMFAIKFLVIPGYFGLSRYYRNPYNS